MNGQSPLHDSHCLTLLGLQCWSLSRLDFNQSKGMIPEGKHHYDRVNRDCNSKKTLLFPLFRVNDKLFKRQSLSDR